MKRRLAEFGLPCLSDFFKEGTVSYAKFPLQVDII